MTTHLHVVKTFVKTWGRSCNSEYEDDACDHLQTREENGRDRCALHQMPLGRDPEMPVGLWTRCSACLQARPL